MKFGDVVFLPGARFSTTGRLNGTADAIHVVIIIPTIPTGPPDNNLPKSGTTERQSARMSNIKNGGLDQYGAEPSEQQQFGTSGVGRVKKTFQLSAINLPLFSSVLVPEPFIQPFNRVYENLH